MNTNNISFRAGLAIKLAALVLTAVMAFTGCDTMPTGEPQPVKPEMQQAHTGEIVLREGDVLKITFPGSPNLDTTQPIRRDGKLTLPLIGDTQAAGMTPTALRDKLIQTYAPQLSTKEVLVEVESSTFPVYVTGAVSHPGKVLSDHPITVLDAVMEAGGPDYNTADLKRVRVVRNVDGVMQHYTVDLKSLLMGDETKSFYLQPDDIVYVPERFSIF